MPCMMPTYLSTLQQLPLTPVEMPVITEDLWQLYLGGIEESIIIENIRLHSKSEVSTRYEEF